MSTWKNRPKKADPSDFKAFNAAMTVIGLVPMTGDRLRGAATKAGTTPELYQALTIAGLRRCPLCKTWKSRRRQFHQSKGGKGHGVTSYCKMCRQGRYGYRLLSSGEYSPTPAQVEREIEKIRSERLAQRRGESPKNEEGCLVDRVIHRTGK